MFSDSRCKNVCKMLADLCPCFHQSPTKLYPDLISFSCWIVTEFWSFTHESGHSRSKLRPILCRLRTKLCPNFGRSHARLCPISFAPYPFPNLAGTPVMYHSPSYCVCSSYRPSLPLCAPRRASWGTRCRHLCAPPRLRAEDCPCHAER